MTETQRYQCANSCSHCKIISWHTTNWCSFTKPARVLLRLSILIIKVDLSWKWMECCFFRSVSGQHLNVWSVFNAARMISPLIYMTLLYYRDLRHEKKSTSWPKFTENLRVWGWRNEFGTDHCIFKNALSVHRHPVQLSTLHFCSEKQKGGKVRIEIKSLSLIKFARSVELFCLLKSICLFQQSLKSIFAAFEITWE